MKKLQKRFEYVEVDLEILAKSFFDNFQNDDENEELIYQDCFFDSHKRRAIFKILVTPNVEKILEKMLGKNGVNLKKENQLDLFQREFQNDN